MRLNEQFERCGEPMLRQISQMGFEGVVSKRRGSRYLSGRSPDWLFSKRLDEGLKCRENCSENIVVRYQNGLFLPVAGAASLDKLAQEQRAVEVFITRENRNVGASVGASYAPALFAREEEAKKARADQQAIGGRNAPAVQG
jgi:hypothetical protein